MVDIVKETFVDDVVLPVPFMQKLKEVLPKIVDTVAPYTYEIWLYGSSARKELKYGSDLDIMVVIKDVYKPIRRDISLSIEMLDVREDVGPVPVDVIVRTKDFMSSSDIFSCCVRRDKQVLWRPT